MPPAQPTRTSRLVIALGLFAFALLVRGLYVALRGPQLFPDSETYSLAATNLAQHGIFSVDVRPPILPTTRIPPLYAALLALLHYPAASTARTIVLLQGALDAGIAALLFLVVTEELPLVLGAAVAAAYA